MDAYISKDSEFGVNQEFDDDQIPATFISDGDEEEPNEETELIHEQPEHTLDEKINSFRNCIEVLSENTLITTTRSRHCAVYYTVLLKQNVRNLPKV